MRYSIAWVISEALDKWRHSCGISQHVLSLQVVPTLCHHSETTSNSSWKIIPLRLFTFTFLRRWFSSFCAKCTNECFWRGKGKSLKTEGGLSDVLFREFFSKAKKKPGKVESYFIIKLSCTFLQWRHCSTVPIFCKFSSCFVP